MRWNALKPGDVVTHDIQGLVWVCVKRQNGCSMMLSLIDGNLAPWNSSFHMGKAYKVTPKAKARR